MGYDIVLPTLLAFSAKVGMLICPNLAQQGPSVGEQ
jgi:hypothetical protein